MTVHPIQTNVDNAKSHRPYKEAKGLIKTTNNVKPLPPQGHLIHDRLFSMPKFFFKDFMYDMKAVKDGFKGNANDHQSGRLNDVGLKFGGIGIATMLAARTTNPMGRIMEYVGLGAFLASMSLFPKIAIQAPARARFGFDPGLEYIDDQGRKKSVFQDSNYIPFDMYRGDYPSQDFNVIADKLGIPRDVKNRDDITKEQMRKIATQCNTWWMLTAGFATPVMTALICCGLEKLIAPAVEKVRDMNYNSKIIHALDKTKAMDLNVSEIKPNKLSKQVEKLLADYKGKELPKAEFDNLVELLTKEMDANASEGIKEDLKALFKPELKSEANKQTVDDILLSIKDGIPNRNKNLLEKVFVPTKEELTEILNSDDLGTIRDKLKKLYSGKIANESGSNKAFLEAYQNGLVEKISQKIKLNGGRYVNDENLKATVDFAKVLGEFKENYKAIDKCKSFKIEYTNETVLARSYAKFENTLLDVLGIKYKDLKEIKDSEKLTKELVDKKLSELVKDDAKYQKAIDKLAKVMSEMEVKLNGNGDRTFLKDIINAVENNYDNTAKRLNKIGKFQNTIDRLVKADVTEEIQNLAPDKKVSQALDTRKDLYALLDGTIKPDGNLKGIEYVKANAKGVGSSKNQVISRIVERYQGANNSFRRIIHLFDFYKQTAKGGNDPNLIQKGKDVLLSATSAEHTLKLNTPNNPYLYRDIMKTTWSDNMAPETKNALEKYKEEKTGALLDRYQAYIKRFRDIIGNNDIDFTKPEHKLGEEFKNYTKSERTRMAKFNLVAQTSVDTVKNAAARRYGNQKWLRIASAIGGTVLGATVLIPLFTFGRIRNPHNMKKQVSDDASK